MSDDIEKAEHDQLQQDQQQKTIGGSRASTIALEAAGQPPPFGRTAFDVWLEMTGRAPPMEDNDRLEMGRLMEEPTAIRFQRKTGLKVYKVPRVVHPTIPWATGHLDRGVLAPDSGARVALGPTGILHGDLECKTVGYYHGRDEAWSDPNKGEPQRVPLAYLLQPIWYAGIPRNSEQTDPASGVTGYTLLPAFSRPIFIAAQFDLDKPLRVYRWEPDETVQAIWNKMMEACQRFYEDFILTDTPPPASSDPAAASRWLKVKFPKPTGKELVAAPDPQKLMEIAYAYKNAHEEEKKGKAEKERLAVELQRLIGAGYGVHGLPGPDGRGLVVTWGLVHKASYVCKASEYRTLNVKLDGRIE